MEIANHRRGEPTGVLMIVISACRVSRGFFAHLTHVTHNDVTSTSTSDAEAGLICW